MAIDGRGEGREGKGEERKGEGRGKDSAMAVGRWKPRAENTWNYALQPSYYVLQ